jgi:hypothetical protein
LILMTVMVVAMAATAGSVFIDLVQKTKSYLYHVYSVFFMLSI